MDLRPWARRRLFWPTQSMGTDGTLLRKVMDIARRYDAATSIPGARYTSPVERNVNRGMPRHYTCGNVSKSCFLSSIQAIMVLGLAMTTDMASMAVRWSASWAAYIARAWDWDWAAISSNVSAWNAWSQAPPSWRQVMVFIGKSFWEKTRQPTWQGTWRGLACATVSSIYTIVTAAVVGGRLPGNAWQADQRGWHPALLIFSL